MTRGKWRSCPQNTQGPYLSRFYVIVLPAQPRWIGYTHCEHPSLPPNLGWVHCSGLQRSFRLIRRLAPRSSCLFNERLFFLPCSFFSLLHLRSTTSNPDTVNHRNNIGTSLFSRRARTTMSSSWFKFNPSIALPFTPRVGSFDFLPLSTSSRPTSPDSFLDHHDELKRFGRGSAGGGLRFANLWMVTSPVIVLGLLLALAVRRGPTTPAILEPYLCTPRSTFSSLAGVCAAGAEKPPAEVFRAEVRLAYVRVGGLESSCRGLAGGQVPGRDGQSFDVRAVRRGLPGFVSVRPRVSDTS